MSDLAGQVTYDRVLLVLGRLARCRFWSAFTWFYPPGRPGIGRLAGLAAALTRGAAILSDLRPPESGLVLLRGLDRLTLGPAGWRRRVATAPQYHENHVLTATFAFNLLMSRRWPPTRSDLEEAKTLCSELGLDELLERMPGGLFQMVGETGWQLSQGERSRLYVARALLQRAELVILDESFAALDPENLDRALRCVLKRAPALLVIAHP